MKTVLYWDGKVDATITQVTSVDFDHHKKVVTVHSAKDGAHVIPLDAVKRID
jgi:hypothetical protein